MKKIFALFLFICFLLLSACTSIVELDDASTQESSEAVESTNELSSEVSNESTGVSNESNKTSDDSSESDEPFEPYIVRISRADFPIYKGAGYEYGFAAYVKKVSSYTIVEETEDSFGNLWGRLKSGVGWVDLTQNEIEETRGSILSLLTVTPDILNSGNYIHCPAANVEYASQILLKANAQIAKIEFYPTYEDENGKLVEQTVEYTKKNCAEGALLLVDVYFPGDMSEYGIRVTDFDGHVYRYSIYTNLSGEGDPYKMYSYAPSI